MKSSIQIQLVKQITKNLFADVRLYRLATRVVFYKFVFVEPDRQTVKLERDYTDHVVISAIREKKETLIFPADKHGTVLDWEELDGSSYKIVNVDVVIDSLGWLVVPPDQPVNWSLDRIKKIPLVNQRVVRKVILSTDSGDSSCNP